MNYKDIKVGMEVIDTSITGQTWGVGIVVELETNKPGKYKYENQSLITPVGARVFYNEYYLNSLKTDSNATGMKYYARLDTYKDLEEASTFGINLKEDFKGDLNKLKSFLGDLNINTDEEN